MAGPIQLRPLKELRGEHVATITATRIESFRPYVRPADANERGEYDQLIKGDAEVPSVRLALYVNGLEPAFAADRIAFTMKIERADLEGPIYAGLSPWGQAVLGDDSAVVAITGFDALADPTSEQPFLYLRGV